MRHRSLWDTNTFVHAVYVKFQAPALVRILRLFLITEFSQVRINLELAGTGSNKF